MNKLLLSILLCTSLSIFTGEHNPPQKPHNPPRGVLRRWINAWNQKLDNMRLQNAKDRNNLPHHNMLQTPAHKNHSLLTQKEFESSRD